MKLIFHYQPSELKNMKGRPTKKDRRQMDKIKSQIENI